jgi:Ca-activated chloride channel family protein
VLPGVYVPDIIVVLTDGASNTGADPLGAAQQAADRGIRVYAIGFGTESGGEGSACPQAFIGREPGQGQSGGGGAGPAAGGFPRGIDEDTLKSIAGLTGGTYSPAESASELEQVFADLPTKLITKQGAVELTVAFVALGSLLAGAALLLARAWRPLP